MSNCQIIVGSPRKNGNTSIMADMFIEKAVAVNISTEKTFLYDSDIRPCIDCRNCKKGELICLLKDDMKDIYKKLDAADTIIIGTPIYWYGPTAKTKLFIDRLRPYFGNKKLAGKKLGLLLPAGVGEKDCDLTITMFNRICEALEMKYIGEIMVEAYDEGDVKNCNLDSEFEELVRKL